MAAIVQMLRSRTKHFSYLIRTIPKMTICEGISLLVAYNMTPSKQKADTLGGI